MLAKWSFRSLIPRENTSLKGTNFPFFNDFQIFTGSNTKLKELSKSLIFRNNLALSKYRTVGHEIVLYMSVQTWYSDSVQA